MKHVEPLAGKTKTKVLTYLLEQYGFDWEKSEFADLEWLISPKESKLLVETNAVFTQDQTILRVNSQGLYFGELSDAQTDVRLTIEGSQMIAKGATKNVVVLPDEYFFHWVRQKPLEINDELADLFKDTTGYVIIHNTLGDSFSVGRIKNGTLLNFVPKARKINSKE